MKPDNFCILTLHLITSLISLIVCSNFSVDLLGFPGISSPNNDSFTPSFPIPMQLISCYYLTLLTSTYCIGWSLILFLTLMELPLSIFPLNILLACVLQRNLFCYNIEISDYSYYVFVFQIKNIMLSQQSQKTVL